MPHTRLVPEFSFTSERLDQLKVVAPEAFSDGKVNWQVLRECLGDHLEPDELGAEHFGLSWPGKRDSRRLAALPARGALVPARGDGINEDHTGNLFIEGENLEVLKLLQKAYAGLVKMIYIDPPYNTGNDFVYKDNFTDPLGDYLRRTGQSDEEGVLTSNSRADGRFHSNWLSMMYPRLRLARSLLRNDGIVAVSVDDNEMHALRLLMNEVFGEEAFLMTVTWKRRQVADNRNMNQASTDHEYVLIYGREQSQLRGAAKDLDKYKNPDNDPRGPWMSDNLTGLATKQQRPNLHYDVINPVSGRHYPPSPSRGWAYNRDSMRKLIQEGRILWPDKDEGRPRLKRFLANMRSEFTGFSSVQDFGYTTDGAREIDELFGKRVFPFAKPVKLISILAAQVMAASGKEILLDFFAGSATTAQSLAELNRQDGGDRRWICVQMPEPADEGDFATIAEIGKERIRRVAKKLTHEAKPRPNEDLGFRVFRLTNSHFKAWRDYTGGDLQQLQILFDETQDPLVKGWTPAGILPEIMLLEGFPLDSTIAELAETAVNTVNVVTSEHCAHRLLVCLDKEIEQRTLDTLALGDQDVLVCLDKALTDQAKQQLADRCMLKTI
jgi:adenine-specific DNA-methyltransferase